GSKMEEVD
nr:Chain a, Heat shock protein 90-4 [Arabidopsis thaliana]6HPG_b Chain b, Heat shock protein 90-4 [Arabidopsis thaliana]6HPG_c Chain c, Heat shock protein 90-4 [Arabidopsis thaliana]6HPG_d Chain d, Heat shock protein 90-4 [Arabidopsis thaliana]6HPG_e Chain e, Heat shock protein 90-4 [Arabidopsis thaliana]6HPG_f Chain f, Heat shock protein 90-4 [Arabidopsis thaliana]6Q3Q_a Chain a, GLY-SER-LYS-MET-GLU-GLU-VAL-ASP [Arabidopsis]6Q3Q_b Chain b, GLY-SER-LYS-MET-GLU-GLU-VAL-ASP [Arabidopsis]